MPISGGETRKQFITASMNDISPLQSAKREILKNIMDNNDKRLIIMDPKGEYNKLIKAMGLKNVEVVKDKEFEHIKN